MKHMTDELREKYNREFKEVYLFSINEKFRNEFYYIFLFENDATITKLSNVIKITKEQLFNGFNLEFKILETGMVSGFGISEDEDLQTVSSIGIAPQFITKESALTNLRFCGLKNIEFGDPA